MPRPALLLTTRTRSAVAVCLTLYVLVLAVRGSLLHQPSQRPLLSGFGLHGWPLILVNVVMYGYLCWLGFRFVRSTHGRERLVMSGWLIAILLSPLKILLPESAVAVRIIGALGLTIALTAAISLLLRPAHPDGSPTETA
jgi:hypothetical protein